VLASSWKGRGLGKYIGVVTGSPVILPNSNIFSHKGEGRCLIVLLVRSAIGRAILASERSVLSAATISLKLEGRGDLSSLRREASIRRISASAVGMMILKQLRPFCAKDSTGPPGAKETELEEDWKTERD
jgi:hypothetical protein